MNPATRTLPKPVHPTSGPDLAGKVRLRLLLNSGRQALAAANDIDGLAVYCAPWLKEKLNAQAAEIRKASLDLLWQLGKPSG